MRNSGSRKILFAMLAVAALTVLFVLAGCGGDDDEETMMPEPMGYKVTVTNHLSEKLAPIVVTHASNDYLLFTKNNYVTEAAEHQILTGWPCMVVDAIGEDAVSNHPTQPECVEENKVTVAPGGSSDPIMFDGNATALRIIAMVAPTMYQDHYVSAVVDVPMEEPVTVPLSRFDIGHDEMEMDIRLVAENAGTVTIERVGDAMADDGDMMDAVTYTVEVTNNLADELFAPIVVTRVNDELYLFDGSDVTPEAEHQILFGDPMMVLDVIGEGDAVAFHGDAGPPGVLLPAGSSVSGMLETDATALRIIAMVAPTVVPDNYVSAVVNVAGLMASGDYITAPLTRFDIGHDEAVMDHGNEMPDHHGMPQMVHRHGDMMSDIIQVDADMTIGTVKITRQ